MYIIAEFFDFVDSVITNVEESKQTSIYKVLEHIIKRDSENAEMAIPAYIFSLEITQTTSTSFETTILNITLFIMISLSVSFSRELTTSSLEL